MDLMQPSIADMQAEARRLRNEAMRRFELGDIAGFQVYSTRAEAEADLIAQLERHALG